MSLFTFIYSAVLLGFTVLSLVRHDYWMFRIFDYPRLQKFVLSAIALPLIIFYIDYQPVIYWTLLTAMSCNLIYLFILIVPFTFLGKKQVLKASRDLPEQSMSVMVANVYQFNTDYKGCLSEINKTNPDIVLLLETDHKWQAETDELGEKFPFQVKVPMENTYGMLLYSKLELVDPEVRYLVEDDVPSIHTRVVLPNGKKVLLLALHPSPPVPNENPRSTERDKELLLAADIAKDSTIPVVAAGDLNDVAWSYTTKLFLKMSGLLDPRRGRGFFNSFHAKYPFLRFPLDHVFISTDFKLKQIKRLPNFNSDHFPIYIHLQYERLASEEQDAMEADAKDIEIAEEKKTKT